MTRPPPPVALAPHHLRLFALIVDYLLIITLLKLLDQLALGEHWDLRPAPPGGLGISLWWAVALGALIVCKDVFWGRSVGKWLTGIAVAAMPDLAHAPGPARSILRNATLLILPVDAVFVFVDPHGRRLGDRLAGTVVVVPVEVSHMMRRLMAMVILFLGFMLASFLVTPWNMRRSAAYQFAYRAVVEHPDVVRAVGAPVQPDSSPQFKLTMKDRGHAGNAGNTGGSAELVFAVEGPRGKGEAEVVLRLADAPRRWELAALRFVPPVLDQAKDEPLVKPAPPRR